MIDLVDDDDPTPWADPQIQAEYEAALGSFLVSFNRLENLLGDLLQQSLRRLGKPELYRANDRFELKLRFFQFVLLALPDMYKPNIQAAQMLSGERNTLAHGHFDQNPFSGSYKVVTGTKTADLSVARIKQLSFEAAQVIDDFRSCQAYLWFEQTS